MSNSLPDPGNQPTLCDRTLGRLFDLGGSDLVGQLIELFHGATPERIEHICSAEPVAAERAAHTLKASAGSLGAMRMWALCEHLEQKASSRRFDDEYAALGNELTEEYQRVSPQLTRQLEDHR